MPLTALMAGGDLGRDRSCSNREVCAGERVKRFRAERGGALDEQDGLLWVRDEERRILASIAADLEAVAAEQREDEKR